MEMSVCQLLMIVIGYELVICCIILLHIATFKEFFVCKSNNKTGDFEMNLPVFFFLIQAFP